jgi:hypothetical protein
MVILGRICQLEMADVGIGVTAEGAKDASNSFRHCWKFGSEAGTVWGKCSVIIRLHGASNQWIRRQLFNQSQT